MVFFFLCITELSFELPELPVTSYLQLLEFLGNWIEHFEAYDSSCSLLLLMTYYTLSLLKSLNLFIRSLDLMIHTSNILYLIRISFVVVFFWTYVCLLRYFVLYLSSIFMLCSRFNSLMINTPSCVYLNLFSSFSATYACIGKVCSLLKDDVGRFLDERLSVVCAMPDTPNVWANFTVLVFVILNWLKKRLHKDRVWQIWIQYLIHLHSYKLCEKTHAD